MSDAGPDLLFVYGTLMPGHLRWSLLEPWALDWGRAEVPGELWDTHQGWPAATFSPSPSVIPGWWVRFGPGVLDGRLGALDRMEGIGDPPDPTVDPYERVRMEVDAVGPAWAYHATRVGATWQRIERWEGQAEA